jgi:hypothetical protein
MDNGKYGFGDGSLAFQMLSAEKKAPGGRNVANFIATFSEPLNPCSGIFENHSLPNFTHPIYRTFHHQNPMFSRGVSMISFS